MNNQLSKLPSLSDVSDRQKQISFGESPFENQSPFGESSFGEAPFGEGGTNSAVQRALEAGYSVPQEGGIHLPDEEGSSGALGILESVLNVLRTGEYAIGGMLAGKSPMAGIEEKISPSEALGITDEETTLWSIRGIAGLATDILLDPTTYLTFGAGSAIKIATKGGMIPITKSGASMVKKMINSGINEKLAKRTLRRYVDKGGTEAAQEIFGERGLRFMNQMFIPEKHFQTAGKILGAVPGAGKAGKVGKAFAKAFIPFHDISQIKVGSANNYVDHLYKPYIRETKAEALKSLDEIKKMAKPLQKRYGESVGKVISEAIEMKKLTGDKLLDDTVEIITKRQEEMLKLEKATGKEVGEIASYLRHYITPEAQEFISKSKKAISGLPKDIRANLQAGKERGLVRVVSESGEDVSFKKSRWSLTPLKNKGKLIKNLEKINKKKISRLQKIQERLAKGDVSNILQPWQEYKVFLRKHISEFPEMKKVLDGTEEYSEKEFNSVINSIANVEARELATVIKDMEDLVKTSQGREFLSRPIEMAKSVPYQKKIVDLQKKIVKTQNNTLDKIRKYDFFDYINDKGEFFKRVVSEEGYKGAKPLSVVEINDFFKTKHGIDKFFEDNAFVSFAKRKMEHVNYMNTHNFLEQTKSRFGVRIDKAKSTFLEDGTRLAESRNPDLKGFLFPEPIVKHLDGTLDYLGKEETMSEFLKVYDKALALFKKNVTAIFPAFHTRNAYGGMFNNWLAGVKLLDYKLSEKALRGSDDIMTTDIGVEYSLGQLKDLAYKFGVLGQPGEMDVVREAGDEMGKLIASTKPGMKGVAKRAQLAVSEAPRFALETVENRVRLPLFIRKVKQGLSPEDAVKDVYKFHFDYIPTTGLTPFERNVMRRLMPFYTWTRNNIPLQMEQMMKQPGKYANIEKTRRAMFDSDEGEDWKELPDWMRESFSFPAPDFINNFKEDAAEDMWISLDLPLADIGQLPITSEGIRKISSGLTPFLKFPLERYFNKNMFFGGEIYNPDLPRELQTKNVTSALKALPAPLKKYLNFQQITYRDWSTPDGEIKFKDTYQMDARKLHLIRSFLGRYYSTISGVADEDALAPEWITSRHLLGIPAREFDISEEEAWNDIDMERKAQQILTELKRRGEIPYAN